MGTAVTCDGGDDVFALASILPLSALHKNSEIGLNSFFQTFQTIFEKQFIDNGKSTSNHTNKNKFYDIIKSHEGNKTKSSKSNSSNNKDNVSKSSNSITDTSVGILIHRKFSNFPLPLISALHQNIYDDIKWMSAPDEPNIESIHYQYIVLLSPCEISPTFKAALIESSSTSTTNSNTDAKGTKISDRLYEIADELYNSYKNEIFFEYFEDEIFVGKRLFGLSYLYQSNLCSSSSGGNGNAMVLISVLTVDKYHQAIHEDIKNLVN